MLTRKQVHLAVVAVATALTVLATPLSAWADGHPRHDGPVGRDLSVDSDIDPLLTDDALITTSMEAQLPPGTDPTGTTCSYETVQTARNAVPASPSFQLLYVVPLDVTADAHLDVPRSCSDGTLRYSSIARSSRNMASWLDKQGAALNLRTINITYTHNYTGNTYSTRGVRRFRSAYTLYQWNDTQISAADGTSPRLSMMRTELQQNGFNVSSTKYAAVLDAHTQRKCTSGACGDVVGVAQQNGQYGVTMRHFQGTTTSLRFGCATLGDAFFAHEAAHQVNAPHVSDHTEDLMRPSLSASSFKSSPSKLWDHGRNDYHATVRANSYVSTVGQAGNYYTCS